MDALQQKDVKEVVLKFASQLGKTEVLLNVTGWMIHRDPSPILLIEPTLEIAQAYSRDRLAPMISSSDALAELVPAAKSRTSANTLLHKAFPGGHVTLAGANSPAGLASRPIRAVLADEVDRYSESAGTEGDPITIARARMATFWNRIIVLVSSPTIRGASRIEEAYLRSDQRRFEVPCPHCGEFQVLWFNQEYRPKDVVEGRGYLRWEKDEEGRATNVRYVCAGCGEDIQESAKPRMLALGRWTPTAPFTGIAGFWLSSLYSPWLTWADLATDFLDAKDEPEKLKAFLNTKLGELWDEPGDRLDHTPLFNRREKYAAEVPAGVLVITAGVDIQDDRIEVEFVGWGKGEESWSIDYRILYGDPEHADLWNRLDGELDRSFMHEYGFPMRVSTVCVDSGGHHTQRVYAYCKDRQHRMVYAIIGRAGVGRPIVSQPSPKRTGRNRRPVKLWVVGVDQAKGVIYSNLRKTERVIGYCHFPQTDAYDEEHFRQLTAEKVVMRRDKGHLKRVWVQTYERNEVLDARVYALAALTILFSGQPNWVRLEKQILKRKAKAGPKPINLQPIPAEASPPEAEKKLEVPPPKKQIIRSPRPRRRVGFVDRWRM